MEGYTEILAIINILLFLNASKIVLEACDVLNKRLAPLRTLYRHTNRTEISWKDLITKAYQAGIELRATGWVFQQDPTPFTYNSYGVACTEGLKHTFLAFLYWNS